MAKNAVKDKHREPIGEGRPELFKPVSLCYCKREPIDHIDSLENARCEIAALSVMLPPLLRNGGNGDSVVSGIASLLDAIHDVIEEAGNSFQKCLLSIE